MITAAIIGAVVVYLILAFYIGYGWLEWFDGDLATPKDMYEATEMNWFGAIFLYILYIITAFPVWLCCFLEWVFHIGRKD